MDPWSLKAQEGRFTRRRISRVAISNPPCVQVEAFELRVDDAKHFAKEVGNELFLSNRRVADPCNFILSRAEKGLPTHGGKRLALAAIILHQALLRVEANINAAWEKSSWGTRREFQERRKAIRGALQTMTQNLLMQCWARIPLELRQALFGAFKTPEGRIDEIWHRVCRGSLSAMFVARAFQGIEITARPRNIKTNTRRPSKRTCNTSTCPSSTRRVCQTSLQPFCSLSGGIPCAECTFKVFRCTKSPPKRRKRWEVYWPTDLEDRWGKIDLITVGRIAGLGRIGLCIQIKTGEHPYLEVLLQEPSDTRGSSPQREEIRDKLWDGVENFTRKRQSEIVKARIRFYPAIIQTGSATTGVTKVAKNTKDVRVLIKDMLEKLEIDLKDARKRERDYREIDEPGLPTRTSKV